MIRIRSPIPDRRVLLDIGVAGPLAGLVAAVWVTIYGLSRSALGEVSSGGIGMGDSLLFHFLVRTVVGRVPAGLVLYLDPVAFAGWLGLLVTTINLLPVGQLDGGHIIYSLFGRRHALIARAATALMFALGFLWIGWIVWGGMILAIGLDHPNPRDEALGLDWRRKLLGGLAIAILVVAFIPVPFRI